MRSPFISKIISLEIIPAFSAADPGVTAGSPPDPCFTHTPYVTDKFSWLSEKDKQGGITVGLDNSLYGWADSTVSRFKNHGIVFEIKG